MKKVNLRNRERLLVIGALDKYINNLARKTIGSHLAMDTEDLISEGRIKVIEMVDKYEGKSFTELVSISIMAVRNMFTSIVRKRYSDRRTGTMIDLDEFAESIYNEDEVSELFLDHAITHLYGMLTKEERKVLSCLIDPPKKLIVKAQNRCGEAGKEVSITVGDIADYLGIGRCKVGRITDRIRNLIPEAAGAYSY